MLTGGSPVVIDSFAILLLKSFKSDLLSNTWIFSVFSCSVDMSLGLILFLIYPGSNPFLGIDNAHPSIELITAVEIFFQVKEIEHLLKKMHLEIFINSSVFDK